MNLPVDHESRLRALDPERSFIVQAPAGSGKTELLIRRFITLLGAVQEPEEIVAITFTRKAAAEMRNRVLRALTEARGCRPAGVAEGELWEIARVAWKNNQMRGWNIDQYPARMQIQTIDSLSAGLTRQMPWLSRFGAPLQVKDDATDLYRAAALDTLSLVSSGQGEWRDAITAVLGHLDNQVNRAIGLLIEMMRFRDQWLRHLGSGSIEAEALQRRNLESAWAVVVRQELTALRSLVPESLEAEMMECARFAAKQLINKGSDSPITTWHLSTRLVDEEPEDLERWQGLRELCLTSAGELRRRVSVNNGFPPDKAGPAPVMKERMNKLLKALADYESFRVALDRVKLIPPLGFDDVQWQALAALTRLLPLAAARLNVLFAERSQVDFAEINMRANSALGSLDTPTDLALRLDHRISHLLVDEFQDTSLTQFELVKQLTAGWVDGDGRTLFLVGDPMQSIYRFREAEVGLFRRVRQYGLGSIKPEPLTLSVNFRSDRKLVDWVNQVFSTCFPDESQFGHGAVSYAPSSSFIPSMSGAGVTFHPLRDATEQDEARQIAEVVRVIRKRSEDERIAILVRSRSSLQAILPALEDAGIDYSGLDIERLTWQPVVQDLLSLTRALLFPADRVAWLSVLRAPWCGLTLNDLYHIAAPDLQVCIWARLCGADTIRGLSEDGRRRLERFIVSITGALDNRGRLGLRRWVENTWIDLGGPACINTIGEINARTYFELLGDHERKVGIGNLGEFIRRVDQCWSHTEDRTDQRLQVMTIHKAKGLEFDTVIVPGLHRKPRLDDSKLLLWEENLQSDGPSPSLLLAPVAEVGGDADPHYRYLRSVHAEKDHYETLRLLYVGCTRARRALHLFANAATKKDGSLQRPSSRSLLAPLWSMARGEFEEVDMGQFEHDTADAHAPDAEPLLRRLPVDWSAPVYPDSVHVSAAAGEPESAQDTIEFSWVGETARHVGVIVHQVLERVAEDGTARWPETRLSGLEPAWCKQLIHLGVVPDEAAKGARQILSALSGLGSDVRSKWLFASSHTDARNEYAISARYQGAVRNYRIDRTFVDADGIRWIVDFKSNMHEGGDLEGFLDREQERYRSQLEAYAGALSKLENRPIRLGLYFPLVKGWREWVFEKL